MVTVKKKATFSSFQTSIQIPELHKDKTNKQNEDVKGFHLCLPHFSFACAQAFWRKRK